MWHQWNTQPVQDVAAMPILILVHERWHVRLRGERRALQHPHVPVRERLDAFAADGQLILRNQSFREFFSNIQSAK